ncbi:MAG TPA: SRPBCC family protein [Fimbriimonadaceae bacterium]|jgi:uncharacterized protein YndB with AHSA1/START domain
MKDTIERSIYFQAPVERVWRALTTKEEINAWFTDRGIDGDIAVGEDMVMCFKLSSSDETGRCRAKVETMDAPSHFAYRWLPGNLNEKPLDEVPTTLVEFFLVPEGEGTRVTVKESGFASLPENLMADAFKDNSEGWAEVMESFRKYGESWNKQSTAV